MLKHRNAAIAAPLILLFGCERECPAVQHAPVGDTVVAIGDILNTRDAEVKLSDIKPGVPEPFVAGCKLGIAPDAAAVIQCLDRNLLVKFQCRDHQGSEHALSIMVDKFSYTIYCR